MLTHSTGSPPSWSTPWLASRSSSSSSLDSSSEMSPVSPSACTNRAGEDEERGDRDVDGDPLREVAPRSLDSDRDPRDRDRRRRACASRPVPSARASSAPSTDSPSSPSSNDPELSIDR